MGSVFQSVAVVCSRERRARLAHFRLFREGPCTLTAVGCAASCGKSCLARVHVAVAASPARRHAKVAIFLQRTGPGPR